jgi:hypothetical protein
VRPSPSSDRGPFGKANELRACVAGPQLLLARTSQDARRRTGKQAALRLSPGRPLPAPARSRSRRTPPRANLGVLSRGGKSGHLAQHPDPRSCRFRHHRHFLDYLQWTRDIWRACLQGFLQPRRRLPRTRRATTRLCASSARVPRPWLRPHRQGASIAGRVPLSRWSREAVLRRGTRRPAAALPSPPRREAPRRRSHRERRCLRASPRLRKSGRPRGQAWHQ